MKILVLLFSIVTPRGALHREVKEKLSYRIVGTLIRLPFLSELTYYGSNLSFFYQFLNSWPTFCRYPSAEDMLAVAQCASLYDNIINRFAWCVETQYTDEFEHVTEELGQFIRSKKDAKKINDEIKKEIKRSYIENNQKPPYKVKDKIVCLS